MKKILSTAGSAQAQKLYKLYIITAPPLPQALDSSSVRELFPQVYVSFLDM